MDHIEQTFSVRFEYKVYFTSHLFAPDNFLFRNFLRAAQTDIPKKIFFVIDEGVATHHPGLKEQISNYFAAESGFTLVKDIMVILKQEFPFSQTTFKVVKMI